jgi:hydrogenase/urease accessory protein HupE
LRLAGFFWLNLILMIFLETAICAHARRDRGAARVSRRWVRIFLCARVFVLSGILGWLGGGVTLAHDPGISTAQGELRSDALVLTTGFAPLDVQHLLPPESRSGETWNLSDFEAVRGALTLIAPQLWEARLGEVALVPRAVRVQLLAGDNVSFEVTFPLGSLGGKLALRLVKIAELPEGHRQFVIIADERGSTVAKKLLSARDFGLEVPRLGAAPTDPGSVATTAATPAESAGGGSAVNEAPTFWSFIELGVEHIWTGYDHLLFLFALLVVCRSFRSIVAIISCFTLAHSLTLALATLDVVALPSRWVEAAIAASIVFVGVENVWRRGAEPRGRWALTFGFGLIHGFGFASVLRDLGVGNTREGIAIPLLTFNLGVELGQIAVASAVLPIIWQLRKNDRFLKQGVPAMSAVVAVAGFYWLLQRTLWS